MKRILNILALVLVLSVILCGCSSEPDSAGGESKDAAAQTEQTDQAQADQKASADNTGSSNDKAAASTDDQKQSSSRFDPNIPQETQEFMNNITGTWESSTPLEDGNANIIRVKIDNVSGFTFTTGTQSPDGTGNFYSRVGSYEIEGDKITFSATTGGESNDGSSYNLRQDFGVYEYTISENPERTQIVLTPTNERAKLLTGEAPVTLNKI